MYPFAKPNPNRLPIRDPMVYAKYVASQKGFSLNQTSEPHLSNLIYGYMSEDTFNEPALCAARGMLIDTVEEKIVIRPIHKFFNVGERKGTNFTELPWEDLIGLEIKHDGTNVNVTIYEGDLIVKTKNSIDNNICQRVKEIFREKQPAMYRFLEEADNRGKRLTASYEFLHNLDGLDQVVNIATEEKFIPLYLIENDSGDYSNFNPEPFGLHAGLEELQRDLFTLLSEKPKPTNEDFVKIFDRKDFDEGLVIKFNTPEGGQVWYKYKTTKYMNVHRAISRLSASRIFNMYLDEELDDVIGHLEQRNDTQRLEAIAHQVERVKDCLAQFDTEVQKVKDMNLTPRELHELTKTNPYAMAANPKVVKERVIRRFKDLYKQQFTNDEITFI